MDGTTATRSGQPKVGEGVSPPRAADLPRHVEVTRLANGLTIVTDRMKRLESAAVGVWVKAGARDERAHEHGIAHLLEHMAFKGTGSRSARDIAVQIENVGGDVNAATSTETTSYFARVLKGDVPLAIEILADILNDALLDAEELRREQHVIVQEIGSALDNPEDVVYDAFQETAFAEQPLGRPIMGTPRTVAALTSADLRDYLQRHYRAPNMVLAASGAVKHGKIVKLAERLFGHLPGDTVAVTPLGTYTGGSCVQERKLMEAQILLGFEGRAYQARDFYASQVLSMLLGGGMSSRLFQEVREKRGLAYAVHAFHWAFADTGIFGIGAATEGDDVAQLVPVVLDELRKAGERIDQDELDRARAQINAGLMMSQESPSSRAAQIARQQLLFGRVVPNGEIMDRLGALTVARLSDLAGRLFQDTKPTLAAVGPVKGLPSAEAVAAALSRG